MHKSLKKLDVIISLIILIFLYSISYYFEMTYNNGIWFIMFPCLYIPFMIIKEVCMRKLYKEEYVNLYK